jgi:hypothetical protein
LRLKYLFELTGFNTSISSPFFILVTLFGILFSTTDRLMAAEITIPFGPGEKITFEVGWGFINAGTSYLSVLDTVLVDDNICWQIESRAHTNKVLSKLYPVNDSIISLMDIKKLFSRGIKKRLREGTYKRDREYRIEPENSQVLKISKGKVKKTRLLDHPVQDVLSAFYWVRTRDIKVGDVLHVEAIDNMKTYNLAVKVLKRETVKVKAGKFDCFKIQPIILGEGLFKAKGEIFVWITADERRIPIKMKSKIFIGAIDANMIEYIPPNAPSVESVLP